MQLFNSYLCLIDKCISLMRCTTYNIFDFRCTRQSLIYDKAVHHKRALRSLSKGKRMIATPRRLSASPAFQNHKYSHELTANCQWWAYIKDLDDAVRRAAPGHVIILPSHTGWMSLFPLRTYNSLRCTTLNWIYCTYMLSPGTRTTDSRRYIVVISPLNSMILVLWHLCKKKWVIIYLKYEQMIEWLFREKLIFTLCQKRIILQILQTASISA